MSGSEKPPFWRLCCCPSARATSASSRESSCWRWHRDQPAITRICRHSCGLWAAYLDELGLLRQTVATPGARLVSAYLDFLGQVRGYAASTLGYHGYTVRELLAFLRFDDDPAALQTLAAPRIEAFMQSVAARYGQAGVRQTGVATE